MDQGLGSQAAPSASTAHPQHCCRALAVTAALKHEAFCLSQLSGTLSISGAVNPSRMDPEQTFLLAGRNLLCADT